ncbi:hypothetical protein C1I98_00445 [Spongiactinospora gelatinilytica]|uniref:Uncharacterized protein n=1 Tax=Spongiactinospora gelatinilytica TaxID=2666298 RepID=A0A2W2HZY4_9ACTN|nr:hypothetical protein [Spongiactinospora gelatinilytica]PZG57005.1 hypothetical protein C1I98_00445 [Spongiactinospora gelatinilytica]
MAITVQMVGSSCAPVSKTVPGAESSPVSAAKRGRQPATQSSSPRGVNSVNAASGGSATANRPVSVYCAPLIAR